MNISSLLITLVGIIIIIGLYLMSRLAQSKQPQIQQTKIPNLKNADGTKFSSVIEDIVAKDGSTPKSQPLKKVTLTDDVKQTSTNQPTPVTTKTQQVILFISSNNSNVELDGNLITKALKANKLILGDKDIYHYFLDNSASPQSLFRVANGTTPWTLTKEDLKDKKITGLSLVMSLPTSIENKKAIELLLSISKKLCKEVNGVLKDDTQQPLTNEYEKKLLSL